MIAGQRKRVARREKRLKKNKEEGREFTGDERKRRRGWIVDGRKKEKTVVKGR